MTQKRIKGATKIWLKLIAVGAILLLLMQLWHYGMQFLNSGTPAANIAHMVLGVGVLLLVIVCLVFGLKAEAQHKAAAEAQSQEREKILLPFRQNIDRYLNPPGLVTREGELCRRGKLLPINRQQRDVEEGAYFGLSENTRASGPGEVGTVVWVDWSREQVGTYGGIYGYVGVAYVWLCRATIIDASIPAIIGSRVLRGSDPPKKVEDSGKDHCGDAPWQALLSFLTHLEQKPSDGVFQ